MPSAQCPIQLLERLRLERVIKRREPPQRTGSPMPSSTNLLQLMTIV